MIMTNPEHRPSNSVIKNKQDDPIILATTTDPVTFSAHLWSVSVFPASARCASMVRIMLRSGGTFEHPRVEIDYAGVAERFTVINPERASIILVDLCPLVNLARR